MVIVDKDSHMHAALSPDDVSLEIYLSDECLSDPKNNYKYLASMIRHELVHY